MKLKSPVYILAAYADGEGDPEMLDDWYATLTEYLTTITDLRFGECVGNYCGERERGFILANTTDAVVLELAKDFEQECVLKTDGQRAAFLLYVDGGVESLGWLVGSTVPPEGVDYTYSPVTKGYYYTRGVRHWVVPRPEKAEAFIEEGSE